jgi:hypothetical protein
MTACTVKNVNVMSAKIFLNVFPSMIFTDMPQSSGGNNYLAQGNALVLLTFCEHQKYKALSRGALLKRKTAEL